MKLADKLITIAEFADSIQADLAKQLLAEAGIESLLAGQNTSNIYCGVPAIAKIQLQVLQSNAKQAFEIIESGKKREQ